jgi:hypothetical protein
MLKTYYLNYDVVINGKEISHNQIGPCILDSAEYPKKKDVVASGQSWISLAVAINNNEYDSHFWKCFEVKKTLLTHKYYIEYEGWDTYRRFYESKNPIEWELTLEVVETELSLERLFSLPNGDKVIEYLKERGMAECPYSILYNKK